MIHFLPRGECGVVVERKQGTPGMPCRMIDEALKRQKDTAPDAPLPATEAAKEQLPAGVPAIECNVPLPAEPAKKNEEIGQPPVAASSELPPAQVDHPLLQNVVNVRITSKVRITIAFLGVAKDPHVKICSRVYDMKRDTGCIYHCDVELSKINPVCEIYGRPENKANFRPTIPSKDCFLVVPDLWDHGWAVKNTKGTIRDLQPLIDFASYQMVSQPTAEKFGKDMRVFVNLCKPHLDKHFSRDMPCYLSKILPLTVKVSPLQLLFSIIFVREVNDIVNGAWNFTPFLPGDITADMLAEVYPQIVACDLLSTVPLLDTTNPDTKRILLLWRACNRDAASANDFKRLRLLSRCVRQMPTFTPCEVKLLQQIQESASDSQVKVELPKIFASLCLTCGMAKQLSEKGLVVDQGAVLQSICHDQLYEYRDLVAVATEQEYLAEWKTFLETPAQLPFCDIFVFERLSEDGVKAVQQILGSLVAAKRTNEWVSHTLPKLVAPKPADAPKAFAGPKAADAQKGCLASLLKGGNECGDAEDAQLPEGKLQLEEFEPKWPNAKWTENEIGKLKKAHRSELESLKSQHENELKRVEAKLQTQLAKLIGENSQLKAKVQQLDVEVAKYKQQIARLQKKNTAEAQNVLAQLQGLLPAVQKAVNDSTQEVLEVRVEEAAKGLTNELQQAVHKLEDESKKTKEETFCSLITNIVKGVVAGLNARNQDQLAEFAFEVNECIFQNAPSIALFREGMKRRNVPELLAVLKSQQAYSLAFHGTPDRNNVLSIFHDGWDPSKRSGQNYGPGEYFATEINTPLQYARQSGAVVIAILLPGTFQAAQNGYCVVNNPTDRSAAFCLPIGVCITKNN